jgi:hypothetical protein
MLLWLERFILPILATVVFGAIILNPFKFDRQQRLSLFLAICAAAYFLAHTIHKPKPLAQADSEQRMSFLERQVENLQSQQKQMEDQRARDLKRGQERQLIRNQLADFLKEGKLIQDEIHYNNVDSLRRKELWEHKVAEYLSKNLDESYAVRFRNPSHEILSYPLHMTLQMRGAWGDIGEEMAMINDFIAELRE